MTDDPTPSSMREPRFAQDERVRQLYADGMHWTVRVLTRGYDRRERPDLIFENTDVVRRVRTYPEEWHALPDDELYALSLRL